MCHTVMHVYIVFMQGTFTFSEEVCSSLKDWHLKSLRMARSKLCIRSKWRRFWKGYRWRSIKIMYTMNHPFSRLIYVTTVFTKKVIQWQGMIVTRIHLNFEKWRSYPYFHSFSDQVEISCMYIDIVVIDCIYIHYDVLLTFQSHDSIIITKLW